MSTFWRVVANDVHLDQRHSWVLFDELWQIFWSILREKKIWNRVDCQRSEEKKSKTHKRLKERFLIGRHRTKLTNFRGSPLFQARYNNKKTNSQFNLPCVSWMREVGGRRGAQDSLIQLVSVGCGRLGEGEGHETESRSQTEWIEVCFQPWCKNPLWLTGLKASAN